MGKQSVVKSDHEQPVVTQSQQQLSINPTQLAGIHLLLILLMKVIMLIPKIIIKTHCCDCTASFAHILSIRINELKQDHR